MKKFVLTGILVVALAASGFTQVFPDEELLDVVYISDGSVLKGKIIEDFQDRYVKIEIFGGSTFTVSYENIDSIEEEPNPDYNTQWIRIEVGDLSGIAERQDGTNGTARDVDETIEFLADGPVLSVYGGMSLVQYRGSDWEETMDDVMDDRNTDGRNGTIGLSYAYLVQVRPEEYPRLTMGFRSGFDFEEKVVRAEIDNPITGVGTGEYRFIPPVLQIPFELLVGAGGSRFAWYLGGGLGASVLLGEPESRFDGEEIGHPSGEETVQPVHAFARGTTGIYFRFGRSNVIGDFRVNYDRVLSGSWYGGYEQYYENWTFGLGLGYRF